MASTRARFTLLVIGACMFLAISDKSNAQSGWVYDVGTPGANCQMTYGSIAADINVRHELATPPVALILAAHGQGMTVLKGHDDWSNLVYSFRSSRAYLNGVDPDAIECNYTPEMEAEINSIPMVCRADFNGDSTMDFFDFLDFVHAFSACDPSADFNFNGVIDLFDYLDYADAFGAGC